MLSKNFSKLKLLISQKISLAFPKGANPLPPQAGNVPGHIT